MRLSKLLMTQLLSIFLGVFFVGAYAMADSGVTSPQDFFAQVVQAVQNMGGLTMMGKISVAIVLVIATMKVTFLNRIIWSKLGTAQVYVAPILGLLAGVLSLGSPGAAVTAASIFAYLTAGAGAVFLHEILDSMKGLPGLGAIYITIINLVETALGGPANEPPQKKA